MAGRVKAGTKEAYGRDLYLAHKGPICTGFALSHHLVYGKNLPSPGDVYTTVDNHNSMVHLARRDVQGNLVNVTETQAAKGMGITSCSGELSGPSAKTHVGAGQERGVTTATWFKAWELLGQQANPPKRGKNIQQASVFTKLCTQHGLYFGLFVLCMIYGKSYM